MKPLRVGVIGCGIISEIYIKNLTERFSMAKVVACADIDPVRSNERARFCGAAAMTTDELLASPDVDVVLILTTPESHAEIALKALAGGKHVYSEKTLATNREDAGEILALAQKKGLRVGCAPDTFLGGGIQTAIKAIDEQWIGRPLSAFASTVCRGHERWHANPDFYYRADVGPVFDMGPYLLTALVAMFGGVRRVTSMGGRAFDRRVISSMPRKGEYIDVQTDTHVSGILEFVSGVLVTVIFSFDIWDANLPHIEVYGTAGTMLVPDPNFFAGPVRIKHMSGESFNDLPTVYTFEENVRGLGLAQMCQAIRSGTPHLANGELAAHVLEIACALEDARHSGMATEITSSFTRPQMLAPGLMETEYGF